MMFLITYQFNPPNPNALVVVGREIQGSALWSHYMDNVWIIDTAEMLDQVVGRLTKFFTPQDRLLVVALNQYNLFQGVMPMDFWEWMSNRHKANNPGQPALIPFPDLS